MVSILASSHLRQALSGIRLQLRSLTYKAWARSRPYVTQGKDERISAFAP